MPAPETASGGDQNAWTNGSEQQWIEMRTQRDRRHRRYAIAAIALAQLEHVDSLKGVLAESPDNSVRSLTIELAGPLGLSPSHLLSLLETSADGVQRQAALLALGHYTRPKWHEAEMAVIRNALQSHATQCHDAGERAALLWLANHNYVDPARLPSATSDVEEDLRQPTSTHPIYMTTSQRQLLVICPAGTVAMGSPPYEEDHEDDEIVHAVIISQAFALSATEVTVEQFLRYSTNTPVSVKYNPDTSGPMGNVSWYEAARYCRWLSQQESIAEDQMCFPPIDEIRPGMSLPEDYLLRTGYRLPTEAEWEYACRAGTNTAWSFGTRVDLFPSYGWTLESSGNRSHTVATLMPNRWGLFDMYGNEVEWCTDAASSDPQSHFETDTDNHRTVDDRSRRVRGGSFGDIAETSRSARRSAQPPESQWAITGFRIARTWSPR